MSEVIQSALAERVKRLTGEPESRPVDPMPAATLDAVHDALRSGETHYTDRPGIGELRERIAGALGLGRSKDEVIVTSGEQEALFVTLLTLALDPGEVAVAGEARAHRSLFHLFDLQPEGAAEGGVVRLRYSETASAFQPGDAPLVIHLRDSLASRTSALSGLPQDAIIIGNLDDLEGIASCRVGFLCAPKALVKSMRSWKQTLSICTASPSQRAAFVAWSQRGDAS